MADTINRIKTSPTKIPLLLFIFPAFYLVICLLECALGLFNGYDLLYTIDSKWQLYVIVAKIGLFAIGAYLVLLYTKKRNIFLALAGLAFIIRSLMHLYTGWFFWGQQLMWLVCGVLLAMPALQEQDQNKEGKTLVILAILYPVLVGVITIVRNNVFYLGNWLYLLLFFIYFLLCIELLYMLALVVEYGREFENVQDLFAAATAGVSAVKTQVADLSNSAKEQASSISSKFTGTDTDVPSTGADAGNTIADVVSGVGTSNLGSTPVRTTSSGGRQYKTVAGPVGLAISNKDSYSVGVNQYAAIIDREAVGGWQLDSIYKIPVTKSAGCLGSLFGKQDETVSFNMLIFYKDE